MSFFDSIAPQYWTEFKSVVVKISEPGRTPYEKTLEQMYQERADRNNESKRKYGYGTPDESARSCFMEAIENAAIKILDAKYILKYAIIREQSYVLYNYYEANYPAYNCPSFDAYQNGECIASIGKGEWRWWVEEMNY